jgi:hypothetical protein
MNAKKGSSVAVMLSLVVVLGAFVAPSYPARTPVAQDPLMFWQNNQTKQAILSFVQKVTNKSGPDFVPPEDRIATLDDGGTLSTEWPIHINQPQMVFARQRVESMAAQNPVWKYQKPFSAILKGDDEELARCLKDSMYLLDLLRASNSSMTVDEFSTMVQNFLKTAHHPKYKVPFTQVAYQPMLELLALLRANDFKVYIVTNYGADFVRELSESVYSVPRERVIGTAPEYEFKETAQGGYLFRTTTLMEYNNKAAKARNIQIHIGRRPILAVGDSNGDIAMLELTAGGSRPFLNLVVQHDDSAREFAYDDNADDILQIARTRGWTIISMKNDFKVVFSFERN